MAGSRLINSGSLLFCPHGGPVVINATGYSARWPNGLVPAKATDVFTVAGCPFVLPGGGSAPCLGVRWIVVNDDERIDGVPTLNAQSIGLCWGVGPSAPVIIAQP